MVKWVFLYVILLKVAFSKNLLTMLSEDWLYIACRELWHLDIGQRKVITGDRAGTRREVAVGGGKGKKHTQQKWMVCPIPSYRPITRTELRSCPSPATRSFVNLESSFSSTTEINPECKDFEKCIGHDGQVASLAQPFKELNKERHAMIAWIWSR